MQKVGLEEMKNIMEKLRMITGGPMLSSGKKIQYFMSRFQYFCQGLRKLKRTCTSHVRIASMTPTQKIQNRDHLARREEMDRNREPVGEIKEAADYNHQEEEEKTRSIVQKLTTNLEDVKLIMQEGEEETGDEGMGKQSLVVVKVEIVVVIVSRDAHPT